MPSRFVYLVLSLRDVNLGVAEEAAGEGGGGKDVPQEGPKSQDGSLNYHSERLEF